AALERPQRGVVRWDHIDVVALSEAERDRWRRRTVGFVFQDFHLIGGLSALDNVLLPATFDHATIPSRVKDQARRLLAVVRAPDANRRVAQHSSGETQRAALARALHLTARARGVRADGQP